MKILMVLTSHDRLGNTGRKTGFWLEEFAAPYYHFKDAGAEIVLASPKGGQPPLDPKSNEPNFQTELTHRFASDPAAKAQLASTVRLDSVAPKDFDTVFYPGGHGPMWDLAEEPNSIKLIEEFLAADKPVALVCHAPGALRHVKTPEGKPLVEGKNVTGFTNTEEEAVGLTQVVPFLVEDELKAEGAHIQDRRLGCPRRHRRPADHRSEPGVLGSRCEGASRPAGQEGLVVSPGCGSDCEPASKPRAHP